MSDTPVEVQFTSAGCLNYPCRTPVENVTAIALSAPITNLHDMDFLPAPCPVRRPHYVTGRGQK
jgi:hypothetical protein